MIYRIPPPEDIDLKVLDIIQGQHKTLQQFTSGPPRRWIGSLRRSAMAKAIRSSNSIEGYHATFDQAIAAIENEPPSEYTDTWMATKGYRDALTYILQASKDPFFEFSKQFLKSLHFMMIGHEMEKSPGQWRASSVYVVNQANGETVYEAPDATTVNELIEELVVALKAEEKNWSPVRGAMAHLNLTMIHPFRDGNGRMARALQTLVMAREGMTDPAFCSIEEWLGENTQEYYQVLAQVGQGKWSPDNSALPWVRFCLKAHYQQAQRIIRRNQEYAQIYDKLQGLLKEVGFNERAELPLFDACIGVKITNARYRVETNVSEYVASRDLKKLCDLGWLEPIGDGRGRSYQSGHPLKEIRQATRSTRKVEDPYVIARRVMAQDAQITDRQMSLFPEGEAPSAAKAAS